MNTRDSEYTKTTEFELKANSSQNAFRMVRVQADEILRVSREIDSLLHDYCPIRDGILINRFFEKLYGKTIQIRTFADSTKYNIK